MRRNTGKISLKLTFNELWADLRSDRRTFGFNPKKPFFSSDSSSVQPKLLQVQKRINSFLIELKFLNVSGLRFNRSSARTDRTRFRIQKTATNWGIPHPNSIYTMGITTLSPVLHPLHHPTQETSRNPSMQVIITRK